MTTSLHLTSSSGELSRRCLWGSGWHSGEALRRFSIPRHADQHHADLVAVEEIADIKTAQKGVAGDD